MRICQLIYLSQRNLGKALDLTEIVQKSRINNKRSGVTGFLMFDGAFFVQSLEGERLAVTQTYNRLASDPRHFNLQLISHADVTDRLFPDWSMGFFDDIPPRAREKLLAHFTLSDFNPKTITSERLLLFLTTISAISGDLRYH